MREVIKTTKVEDKLVSVIKDHFQQTDENTGGHVVFQKLPSNME